MRENKILCHGSFDVESRVYDALPTARFLALEGVQSTDEEDVELLAPILAWFLKMLDRGEAKHERVV